MIETRVPHSYISLSDRPWIAVSYYTINTGYQNEVHFLIESLRKYGCDYYIEGIESRGSWLQNIRYRAEFLIRIMDMIEFSGRSFVWMDADAVVVNPPTLFDDLHESDHDIAVHYRNGVELLGGTIWFNRTEKTKRLMSIWRDAINAQRGIKEQVALQRILHQRRGEFDVASLPASYCKIFDLMRAVPESVVVHNQASRRFKNQVGIDRAEYQARFYAIAKEREIVKCCPSRS